MRKSALYYSETVSFEVPAEDIEVLTYLLSAACYSCFFPFTFEILVVSGIVPLPLLDHPLDLFDIERILSVELLHLRMLKCNTC